MNTNTMELNLNEMEQVSGGFPATTVAVLCVISGIASVVIECIR